MAARRSTIENVFNSLSGDQLMAILTNPSPSLVSLHEERLTRVTEDDMDDAIRGDDVPSVLQMQDAGIPSSNTTASSSTPNTVPVTTLHTCPICSVAHTTAKALRRHRLCHKPAQLACPTCAKVVKRKSDLRRHMRIHQAGTTFVCDGSENGHCACGRVFARRDIMIRHWRAVEKKKRGSGEGGIGEGVL